MVSRRRSVSSQENDERLLEAALVEIADVGIDRLGMSGVARRAGLTTGALYGRYENVYELAAAVWTTRVRDTHFALLDRAVRALVDDDRSIPLGEVIQELVCPSRSTVAALELLATARRIDELDEVVTPAVEEWMQGWRAGTRGTRPAPTRPGAVHDRLGVGRSPAHDPPPPGDGMGTGDRRRRALLRSALFGSDRTVPARGGRHRAGRDRRRRPERAHRFRLGHHRARRLRARHDVADRAPGRAHVGRDLRALPDQGPVARALGRSSARPPLGRRSRGEQRHIHRPRCRARDGAHRRRIPRRPRREWRTFRIEAQLAARHRPELAAALDQVQEAAIYAYLEALGARTADEHRALDAFGRFAQLIPLGLAFVDLVTPGVAGTDWRAIFVPLLAPPG